MLLIFFFYLMEVGGEGLGLFSCLRSHTETFLAPVGISFSILSLCLPEAPGQEILCILAQMHVRTETHSFEHKVASL